MEIATSQYHGRVPVTVFQLKGDLDANTYEQLESRAREAHAAGVRDLVLDLAGVPYISTAGIRAINNIFNLLRTATPTEDDNAIRRGLQDGTFKSPHLKLLNPAPRVAEVLSMAGVDMFLEIHSDLGVAVASF